MQQGTFPSIKTLLYNLYKRLKHKTLYLFYIVSIPKHNFVLDKFQINLKD